MNSVSGSGDIKLLPRRLQGARRFFLRELCVLGGYSQRGQP